MSTSDMSQFGLDTITAKLITMLNGYLSKRNTATESAYKSKIEEWKYRNLVNQGLGLPQDPMPPPPMIMMLNEDLVRLDEQGTGEKDTSNLFFEIPYVYIPPAPPSHPSVIIGGPTPGYPGFFDTIGQGDSPAIPIGKEVSQDGHTYRKTAIGQSPFNPTGFYTRWQQIS